MYVITLLPFPPALFFFAVSQVTNADVPFSVIFDVCFLFYFIFRICAATMLYSVFGRPYMMMGKTYEADPADRIRLIEYLRTTLPEHLRRGLIRPMKVNLWDGGLEKINDGFQYMIQGRVSAEKLVFRLT